LTWCQHEGRKLLPPGEAQAAATIERMPEVRTAVPIWEPKIPRAILKILPENLRPYLIIGCWLGLRPTEIQRLTWGHFDWKRGYLNIDAIVAAKTMEERFVKLNPRHWRCWQRGRSLRAGAADITTGPT
jgi:integrase